MEVKRSILVRVGGVAIAVLSLTGSLLLWSAVGFASALATAIETSSSPEGDMNALVTETRQVVDAVAAGVSDLSTLGEALEQGGVETSTALDSAGRLIEEEVAGSLASVDRALPALVEAGQVIDSTLRTLSFFGVDYSPPVPFDEALIEVQASLAGLPGEVRRQGADLRDLAPAVQQMAADTSEVVNSLEEVQSQLEDVSDALQSAEASTEALGGVLEITTAVGRRAPILRVLVLVTMVAGLSLAWVTWKSAGFHAPGGDGPADLADADEAMPVGGNGNG